MQSTLLLFILSFIGYGSSHPSPVNDLSVKTNSGILGGFTNSKNPNVRQFLGIPFAHPPIGPRRWLPPWLLKSNSFINATSIGPACPQIARGGPTDFTVYSPHGGNQTEIFPSEPFSEDCLTLNVWTPRTNEIDLPVLVWFFGGGFVEGGTTHYTTIPNRGSSDPNHTSSYQSISAPTSSASQMPQV